MSNNNNGPTLKQTVQDCFRAIKRTEDELGALNNATRCQIQEFHRFGDAIQEIDTRVTSIYARQDDIMRRINRIDSFLEHCSRTADQEWEEPQEIEEPQEDCPPEANGPRGRMLSDIGELAEPRD